MTVSSSSSLIGVNRSTAVFVVFAALAVVFGPMRASYADDIVWVDPLSGDWFDANNWEDPGGVNVVPTQNDDTFVNNGGTAQAIDGGTFNAGSSNAETDRLYIGGLADGSTNTDALSGTVTVDAVNVTSRFGTFIGIADGQTPSADGVLTTTDGASSINNGTGFSAGSVTNSTAAGATATGSATIDGDLVAAFGTIGGVFNSGSSSAMGTVVVQGDATGDFTVGSVVSSPTADATGSLTVQNGDLLSRGSAITVGRTSGGGTADGEIIVETGTFTSLASAFNSSLSIGVAGIGFGGTPGGDATGHFESAGIDTSLNELREVVVGQSSGGNSAVGHADFGTGDLNVTDDVAVGRTFIRDGNGSSDGTLNIDGAVIGRDSGSFQVGVAQGFAILDEGNGTATGLATADAVQDFRFFDVGVVRGPVQNDAEATGELHVGSGGITGTPTVPGGGGFDVDTNSSLIIGGNLGTLNNNQVRGVGGTATGTATVTGGDISGLSGVLAVGRADYYGTAEGDLTVTDGNISADGIQVGFVSFYDPETHIADPNATLPSATGTLVQTNGSMTLPDGSDFGSSSAFSIGVAFENGSAKGTVDLTNVEVVGDTLRIGSALFAEDQSDADGSLTMQGGSLQMKNVSIGTGSAGTTLFANGLLETTDTVINISEDLGIGFGPGNGTVKIEGGSLTVGEQLSMHPFQSSNPGGALLEMTNSALEVGQILVGTIDLDPGPPNNASSIILVDTDATIANFFLLGQQSNSGSLFGESLLSLTRSLVDVGTEITFQKGSDVEFMINGLARGTEYGAINAESAVLGNLFEGGPEPILTGGSELFVHFDPTFFDTSFMLPEADFDLIVTELIDGIALDFSNVSFSGIPTGYLVTSGIVTDLVDGNTVEIYRVSLVKAVPEPSALGSLAVVLALAGLRRPFRRMLIRKGALH